jgi:hypothetical protein
MAGYRFVAVVGARVLPESAAPRVAEVVRWFLSRGWGICSGGARGADAFALEAVLAVGPEACARSAVFLPGPAPRVGALGAFASQGGRVVPGSGGGRVALLARSRRLARESAGVVAFLWGPSRGSVYTVREAIAAGKPAAVVLAGGGATLPRFARGSWVPCTIGSVAAHRWVAGADGPGPRQRPRLARVFEVPEGEPVASMLEHISSLSQGDRLWFERGVLAGDTVLVAHEVLSDTPAFLVLPRLRRRFRCSEREAAGLAELFLALDAGPAVVAHYEAEARQRGVVTVIEDLVYLVARIALAEAVPDTDALEHAERLGDDAERVTEDGHVAQRAVQPEPEGAQSTVQSEGWHALGTVHPEPVTCPVCRAPYEPDPDAAELPVCPGCGTRDTWEARQGAHFRELIAAIDGCPSLEELASLGKRLYALDLVHDQAGVAWSHYHLRQQALEAALTLRQPARCLLSEVEHASRAFLPRLGGCLYRIQHTTAVPVSVPEWRRIWQAYRARRPRRAA